MSYPIIDQLLPQCEEEVKRCLEMIREGKDHEAFNRKGMLATLKVVLLFQSTSPSLSSPKEDSTEADSKTEDSTEEDSSKTTESEENTQTTQTGLTQNSPTPNGKPPKSSGSTTVQICPTHYKKPCKQKD